MIEAFQWIIPSALAGSAQPGLLADLASDLAWLHATRITHVVTLTERPLALPDGHGFVQGHFPIPDMGVVSSRAVVPLCCDTFAAIRAGGRVLVHCKAGLGRTGTIAACCLVSLGQKPEAAIRQVRSQSPHAIQSVAQERFVHHYAEHLQSLAAKDQLPSGFRLPMKASPVVELANDALLEIGAGPRSTAG